MKCSKCNHINPEDAKFCNQCGIKLDPYQSAIDAAAIYKLLGHEKSLKIFVKCARLSYAVLEQGHHEYKSWFKAMKAETSDLFRDVAGFTDEHIDAFIEMMWDFNYKVGGETHKICEWASLMSAEIKCEQKNKLFDSELLALGVKVAELLLKTGTRSFPDYVAGMVYTIGDQIRPYLKSIYIFILYYPGMEDVAKDMSPYEEVLATNVNPVSISEEMKDEAIHRMKSISLYDGVIESFEEDGAPQVYEPPYGASYWLEEDELERIREVEKSENILVWGVMRRFIKNIFSSENIAEDHLLYVSRSKDKWAEERERLLNGNPHVYTLRLGHLGSKDVSIYRSEGGTPLVQ